MPQFLTVPVLEVERLQCLGFNSVILQESFSGFSLACLCFCFYSPNSFSYKDSYFFSIGVRVRRFFGFVLGGCLMLLCQVVKLPFISIDFCFCLVIFSICVFMFVPCPEISIIQKMYMLNRQAFRRRLFGPHQKM